MGRRTEYAPGTFCWTDLITPDPAASKEFYGALFDWSYEDQDAGEGLVYTLISAGDAVVGGLHEGHETPPGWSSYIAVEDADGVADRAAAAGGAILQGSFDASVGRMAILRDPTDAVFVIWQGRERRGADLVNAPGALTLNQLNTSDPEAAQAFYREVFGWRIEDAGEAGQQYWGIYNGDALNGGMMPLPPGAPVSHWLVYFASADLDAHAAQIADLGGTVLVPPMPIESGRILVADDPQGGGFALFEGTLDP